MYTRDMFLSQYDEDSRKPMSVIISVHVRCTYGKRWKFAATAYSTRGDLASGQHVSSIWNGHGVEKHNIIYTTKTDGFEIVILYKVNNTWWWEYLGGHK